MSNECSRCYGRGYFSDGFGRIECPRCYGTGKADAKHPQVVFAEERDARIRAEARREALEEASKLVASWAVNRQRFVMEDQPTFDSELERIRAAIRALAKEPKP